MTLLIEDYALIGDCQTAALVGRDGSIDWLCLPRFDSGACFAALLGTPEHGRWRIAPAGGEARASRRYRGESLVLDTAFETPEGAVVVTDCMPVRGSHPDLVRVVMGVRGKVRMRSEFSPRFDYGHIVPWLRREPDGVRAVGGPDTLRLRTTAEFKIAVPHVFSEFDVAEGQQVPFVLTWTASHAAAPLALDAARAVTSTEAWWKGWARRCAFEGEYRDAVVRSLITLKALTYTPTGGLVAAATTSLPEQLGGPRNWDYRYCWLRDATFTLAALMQSGYTDEAAAWQDWLQRTVAGSASELNIMYGLDGERRLTEVELDWLPGYEGSRPVRVGNAAHKQFQLDVFGEVLDCLHLAHRYGIGDGEGWRIPRNLLGALEEAWHKPDEGIWEVRGPRRQFTHSKMMAWVAFDRGLRAIRKYGLEGPAERWRGMRDQIHAEVCERGFDREVGAFVQYYGSKGLDASLLMMPQVGFLPPDDPRVVGTVKAIERRLMQDGFVRRYDTDGEVDGLPQGEGAFLLCTLWLADCYSLMGREADARRVFEGVLAVRNDVGLLSEEFCPRRKRLLGNFPQAFSHVGVANTARNLTQADKPAQARHRD